METRVNSISRSTLAIATLVAATSACSEPAGPGEAGPAKMEAKSLVTQTGVVGQPVADLPTVLITNAAGHPIEGVSVTFVLFGGDGSIAGEPVMTNAQGTARLSAWILGRKSRVYSVVARSQTLEAQFNATAVPGFPAAIDKIAGNNQIASGFTSAPLRPTVQVNDEFGNGVSGVSVSFTITSGGGRLEYDTGVTDGSGAASPGMWTVGQRGPQSLVASAASIGSTTFVATAIGGNGQCELPDLLPQNAEIRPSLTQSSCVSVTGEYFSWYSIDVTESRPWNYLMRSTQFDPFLELRDINGNTVASSRKHEGAPDALMQAMVPPGRYTLVTTTSKPGVLGAYGVKHFNAPSQANGCDGMYVMKGTAIATVLIPGICHPVDQQHSAIYRIYLTEGASMQVKLLDRSYAAPNFEISTEAGTVLQQSANTAFYEQTAVFTAPASGVYVVRVYSDYEDGFEYTIDFQ